VRQTITAELKKRFHEVTGMKAIPYKNWEEKKKK
jgi:hypothetical protein